ncbi:MAG: vacuolar amino acid transporter 4 [Paramarteilia canceri]
MTGFVFAFEGIGLLIPVLKTASTPTRGAQMFSLAISFSVVVYCFTGIVVYLRVGNSVDQIFPHSLSGKIVQVATELYILGVQMGFGLQYLVAHEMMNALIDLKKSNPEQEKETMHQYMTKMYFVFLVMFLIIIFIPHLDALISIFGALFGVFLSFTLPLFLVGVKIISEKYQQAIFIDGREAKMKDLIKMDPKFGGKLLALGSIIISSLIIIFLSLTESISKIRKSVV